MDKTPQSHAFVMEAFKNLKACVWSAAPRGKGVSLHAPVPSELVELQALGSRWLQWVFPSDQGRVAEWFKRCSDGSAPHPIDYRLITEANGIVWVRQWRHEPEIKARSTRKPPIEGTLVVISPLKQLEAECLRICERERNAIGQELHDDICQLMAGLSCMLDVLGKQISKVRPDLHAQLDELSSQIYQGMERTRVLAHGLVPSKLVNMGLPRALAELARQTEVSRQIKVTVACPAHTPTHSDEQTLHLYRIAQESISNAIKHGKATVVTLTLKRSKGLWKLSIRDNGQGMAAQSDRPQGIGMHVMQFRASILGADLALRSSRGKGVLVEVTYACSDPSMSCSSLIL